MFSCLFLWVQVQYSKHLGQGHNVFFLQRTHVASMYEINFPKIKWKHITYVFIIQLMKIFITLKTFNVNMLYYIIMAQCVSMFRKIDVETTSNMYVLIDFFL
jgi:hypothetical protein